MLAIGHGRGRRRALTRSAVVLAASCLGRAASAEEAAAAGAKVTPSEEKLIAPGARGVDTSYGRLAGDMAVSAGLGAAFGPRSPRAAVDLRLRYLSTAGVYATYEDGALIGDSSDPRRALSTGIELRPLFLARWLQGWEWGSPYPDLALDSLGLELGLVLIEPLGDRPASAGADRGFASKPALQAGIGLEVPLLPRASGPLIGVHGAVRWSDAALGGEPIAGPSDRAFCLLVTLGWQQLFGAHVVDLADRAPR